MIVNIDCFTLPMYTIYLLHIYHILIYYCPQSKVTLSMAQFDAQARSCDKTSESVTCMLDTLRQVCVEGGQVEICEEFCWLQIKLVIYYYQLNCLKTSRVLYRIGRVRKCKQFSDYQHYGMAKMFSLFNQIYQIHTRSKSMVIKLQIIFRLLPTHKPYQRCATIGTHNLTCLP